MGWINGWILSMKVVLISAGILSLAIGLKFTIPVALDSIPAIWSVVLASMKPPYLYIIINGIIITIAATSRFHHGSSPAASAAPAEFVSSEHSISVKATPPPDFALLSSQPMITRSIVEEPPVEAEAEAVVVYESDDRVVEVKPVMVNGSQVDMRTEKEIAVEDEAGDIFVESAFAYDNSPPENISSEIHQLESLFPMREKPLVKSRFGHRKPIRPTPEVSGGRIHRVTRPKKHETLESTWKMITEGRHVPLTRHLKKSDTWEHQARQVIPTIGEAPKAETFNDRSTYHPVPKIKKEPSLGQDELNKRVEAFIKKFNDDMRMQRQESLNQYMEMIKRGV